MLEKKTDVVSIRIENHIKEKLVEESKSNNLTLNSLVGQIITKHVSEGTIYQDLGFTSVRKSFLKILFKCISDPDIIKISEKSGKEFFKDTTIYLQGKYNLESIIKTLDSWFATSNIPFKKIESEEDIKLVIHHKLGSKWVLYFETMMKSVLDELGIKSNSYVKTIHSLSFRVYK